MDTRPAGGVIQHFLTQEHSGYHVARNISSEDGILMRNALQVPTGVEEGN